jgi:hypothetical protein
MEPLLPCTALYLLIRVTFSTPTAIYIHRVNKAHLKAQGEFLAAIKISPKPEKLG